VHEFLCFPGLTDVVVQVGYVVTRFIPLCILSYQTGDIGLIPPGGFSFCQKKCIQFPGKGLFPSHQLDESLNVLRNVETVLPGIGFRIVEVDRKKTALFILMDKGLNEVVRPFLIQNGQKRMQCTVRIPEGKYGIIVKAVGLVHLQVPSQVFSIYIHIEIRAQQSMI